MPKPAARPKEDFLSGWGKAGLINTVLIWTLSIVVVSLLFSSAFRLGSGWSSFLKPTVFLTSSCKTVSRTNVLLHIAINAIATLVVASSNFFMQILCAPTRENVDNAHRQGRYVEIAVQSFTNLRHISTSKVILWLILAASAVPLHLFFNSCITESIASTDFNLVVAAESFLNNKTTYESPGIWAEWLSYDPDAYMYPSFLDNVSLAASKWQRMTLNECLALYDDPSTPLTSHRHIVMIVNNEGENNTAGWNGSAIRKLPSDYPIVSSALNSIWTIQKFSRTDDFVGLRHDKQTHEPHGDFEYWDKANWIRHSIGLDINTIKIIPDPKGFLPSQPQLVPEYCLSESFVVPCELHVQNLIMLIVCIFCVAKAVVCLTTIIWFRHHDPLVTLGDAIESFMVTSDSTTEDMCWLSRRPERTRDLWRNDTHRKWPQGPRQWKKTRHRMGASVSLGIWIFSYFCILAMLGWGVYQIANNWEIQPWFASDFGPSSANGIIDPSVYLITNTLGAATLANSLQVGLSIAYMTYNGLFTRMLSEREWASFECSFRSLRVSRPKGLQKSTYRLQLPYRWSIPLMFVSGIMHWLVSNTVYIRAYISYPALPPYIGTRPIGEAGLGFSIKATVVTVTVGFAFALAPLVLAAVSVPGNMVLAANNSAVMSAACHSIPTESMEAMDVVSSPREGLVVNSTQSGEDPNERTSRRILHNRSTQKLKWGVVSRSGSTAHEVGHMAFGTMDQEISSPVKGWWYA